jgi:receptor protein-tyrosine kinase
MNEDGTEQTMTVVEKIEVASGEDRPTFTYTDRVKVVTDENSLPVEAIRAMRGNLLAHHVKLGRRALKLCAPSVGGGCYFLSANLAVAFAQSGINTLLVDANLREPGLQEYIDCDQPTLGLSDCLSDPALPLRQVIHHVQPTLSVLYAGTPTMHASDLLSRDTFRSLAGHLLRDYELTIIDTPPSNIAADARRIASIFRHSLVVACANRTYLKDVEVLIGELAGDGSQVVGTFLNEY